jgi:hypothetical protein
MTTDTLTVDLNMPHRAVKAIPSGALRLVCREGCVWITLDHDQQDVILNAGDVFVAEPHHRVIAYALQAAVLRLEPVPCTRRATASRWRWRWLPRRRARGLATA